MVVGRLGGWTDSVDLGGQVAEIPLLDAGVNPLLPSRSSVPRSTARPTLGISRERACGQAAP